MNNSVNQLALGKYRAIIISIGFFLVFDLGVLILNYYISTKIEKDAVAVNLAGRQRMLSQRMVKTLLETQSAVRKGENTIEPVKELSLTFNLFDKTLNSFNHGGVAVGGNGQPVLIEKVNSPKGRDAINDALKIWSPYREKVLTVIDSEIYALSAVLPPAIEHAKLSNLKLLKLMNNLTSDLETLAGSKAERLRMIQTTGIMLALGNFFLIMFHFLKQLRQRDEAVEKAKQETDEILGTVNEGLFLLDADFSIGSQYSHQLENLLGQESLAGKNFVELINSHIDSEIVDMSKDYLELLFEGRVKEKLVTSLNPLHEVAYSGKNNKSKSKERYLDFSFNRVVMREGVKHILVTVNDVTQKMTLLNELERSEKNNKVQIELLLDMLKTDTSMLKDFIEYTETELFNINTILKDQNTYNHRDKLKEIYSLVHTIKGNASAIGMGLFLQRMHEFEDTISEILSQSDIKGKDFLRLAIKLENSLVLVETIRTFLDKIISISSTFNGPQEHCVLSSSYFNQLIQRVSTNKGKMVEVEHDLFNPGLIPQDKAAHVRDIVLQLIRNSVVHGIEDPQIRVRNKKSMTGKITLSTKEYKTGVKVLVRDDGRGIDIESIRDKAIQRGHWLPGEVYQWDKSKLVSLIFEDQFSTADTVDEDAGRGVGMSVVKQILQRIGGGLGIRYEPGQYCEFQIKIPT